MVDGGKIKVLLYSILHKKVQTCQREDTHNGIDGEKHQ